VFGVVSKSTDPFDTDARSDPVHFETSWRLDPDLFWDDDGTLYVATSGILLRTLDLNTGEVGESVSIWNGTGGESPEGPHIYKKDGWYNLMIADDSMGLNRSVTIARSENITSPYESYNQNPILTNRGTDEYFQTVGHADLFQDPNGNWWGMCLTTCSGPITRCTQWDVKRHCLQSQGRGRMACSGACARRHEVGGVTCGTEQRNR
jgi:beta-xylosidase